jgi:hypothetical protein
VFSYYSINNYFINYKQEEIIYFFYYLVLLFIGLNIYHDIRIDQFNKDNHICSNSYEVFGRSSLESIYTIFIVTFLIGISSAFAEAFKFIFG